MALRWWYGAVGMMRLLHVDALIGWSDVGWVQWCLLDSGVSGWGEVGCCRNFSVALAFLTVHTTPLLLSY